ncbi:transporter substrate-binding domain-containing protein [Streptomyces sp. NPDC051018]|uniref:bifunctional serine/threonine-protein kinase/glutamate ABC transporter substrate-binding protein n=1 Tax=Streptomyces sp. NPDC051018 TaxID=3365639 RepID=UPI00378D6ED9
MIDGRFELLARLGGGGMGLVWRARDLALHREVALKEVRPPDPALAEYDPEGARALRARAMREARALARIDHPNVVTIFHIVDGDEHPYPWLVMELVRGGSLQDRLDRSGTLTPEEAARVGRGVLAGLRAAHDADIQHRDIKPPNVLLRPDGRPVLTDFGIAAIRDATVLTAAGSVIGTPDYMAPERVGGQDGGPEADLWSLALMLYVAVEGRNPLRRANTLATLAAVLSEDVPPPRNAGPLTGALTAVLVRDPGARPDAETLERLLAAVESAADAAAGAVLGAADSRPRPGAEPEPRPTAEPRAGSDPREAGPRPGVTTGADPRAGAIAEAGPHEADSRAGAAPEAVAREAGGEPPVAEPAPDETGAPTSYPLAPPTPPRPSPSSSPSALSSPSADAAPPSPQPSVSPSVSASPSPSAPPRIPPGRRRRVWAYAAAVVAVPLTGVLLWNLLPGDDGGDGGGKRAGNAPKTSAPATSDGGGAGGSTGDGSGTGERLTIGIKFDQPGLGLRAANGGYKGFDVDVATYLARELGYTPDRITWKEVRSIDRETKLLSGEVDLIVATYAINERRKTQVDFVGPYLVAHQDVLTHQDDLSIGGPAGLDGKKVCAATGTTSALLLKQTAPAAQLQERTSYAECMDALAQGAVDAVTTDDAILAGYAAQSPGDFRLGGLDLSDENYGIGVPKNSRLKAGIEKALKTMVDKGDWKKALERNLPLLRREGPSS